MVIRGWKKRRGVRESDEDMDVDGYECALKVGKVDRDVNSTNAKKAGPADWSCENQ